MAYFFNEGALAMGMYKIFKRVSCQTRNKAGKSGKTRGRGFTLIELLVVIGIIAVLAAILLPVIGKLRVKGYIAGTKNLIHQLETAIQSYEMDWGNVFPASETIYDMLTTEFTESAGYTLTMGPYLDFAEGPNGVNSSNQVVDAWEHPIEYRSIWEGLGPLVNEDMGFDLWSWGPDEQVGTNDDILNYTIDE